jgi:hypothetical protein
MISILRLGGALNKTFFLGASALFLDRGPLGPCSFWILLLPPPPPLPHGGLGKVWL